MAKAIAVLRLGEARFESPLPLSCNAGAGCGRFVSDETWVLDQIEIGAGAPANEGICFERAGPRAKLFFEPGAMRAAIVTCGGLCPGLNNVIRSLFVELHYRYGALEVLGIRNGYLGLNAQVGPSPIELTSAFVDDIQYEGGTMLGTSRGPQQPAVMVDFLRDRGVAALFCIGGDGTLRGAHAIAEEIARRKLDIAVVGIPKTIDNDVMYCDRTFGYFTAIEKAREVLHLAHTEAKAAMRGIGLVKVMGRHAGFIACGATIVSQEVNFALIPEARFTLDGPRGFLAALERRMEERRHALIVVAEGAGQDFFKSSAGLDKSQNVKLHDIGPFLKDRIARHFDELGKPVDIKYIDPSYIIRGVAANMADSLLCDQLARHAVHAALSGRTDMMVGFRHGKIVHVPLAMVIGQQRRVDPEGDLWTNVLASTGQPGRFE
jgi:6-phosphofructokinase 1